MRKKLNKALSFLIGAATLVSIGFGTAGQKVEAAEGKAAAYKEVIEFEDANNFEQNGQNYIDSSMFHGYSGSGYVYLVSGWSEVNFNIPQSEVKKSISIRKIGGIWMKRRAERF